MTALLLALLFAPTLSLDEAAAGAQLEALRRQFPTRAKAQSIAELERLADEAAGTPAGGRALLWLGDLSLQAGETARADGFYRRATAFADGDLHRLSLRGRGDVALSESRFRDAERLYAEAMPGAPPMIGMELAQKHAAAIRLRRRSIAAYLATALVALVLAWFVVRIRRGAGPLGVPLELVYVAPVYALLIIGCVGRDENVLRALAYCAPASMIVIATSALASRRSPAPPWLHAAALAVANAAIFYAVLYRANLLDTLLTTLGTAAPS